MTYLQATIIAIVSAVVGYFVPQMISAVRQRRCAHYHQRSLIKAMLEPWMQATTGLTSEQIYHVVQAQQTQNQQQALQILLNFDNRIKELE